MQPSNFDGPENYRGFIRKPNESDPAWAQRKRLIDMAAARESKGPKQDGWGKIDYYSGLHDQFSSIRGDAPKSTRKAPVNLNPRSREYMEAKGYKYMTTEHYDVRTTRKHDHMGIFDALCYGKGETVGVQITTAANKGARRKKILSSPNYQTFKDAGNRVLLLTWLKNEKGRWEAEETWL